MAVLTPAGVYAPGRMPPKSEIIQLLEQIMGSASNPAIVKQTKVALDLVTPASETYGGLVLNDPDPTKNGYYYRSSGTWVKGRSFPDTMAQVTLAGTSAAQTGDVPAGVDPNNVLVFFAIVQTPNGGSGLTLQLTSDEAPRPVVNAAGNVLAAGEWTGAVLFFLNGDGEYQLLIDAGAAASAAQSATDAQAARDEAVAAMVFNPVIVRFTSTNAGPYDMGEDIGTANLLDVKLGGVWQDHDKYTVAGSEFTFTFDPGAGLEMEAVLRAEVRRVDAPADGSVGVVAFDSTVDPHIDGIANDVATEVAQDIVNSGGYLKGIGNEKPTICLTFDYYVEATTNARTIMDSYDLVGTFFVAPYTVGAPDQPTRANLALMKALGWEIGAYTDDNWVTLEAADRLQLLDDMKALKDDMHALGLPVTSLAPNQRAWNQKLAYLVEDYFSHVRVVDIFRSVSGAYQSLPVPNRLWVREGGTASLTTSDTEASLSAQVDDLIEMGGLWTVIIHRVSNVGDENYRVPIDVFTAFCAKIAAERDAGNLRVVRFGDL